MITNHSINITNIATGEERNTLYHWHMFPAGNLNFAPPEPKLSYEETPGSDGALDSTEATADRVLYNNRSGEWEFYVANRPSLITNVDETLSWADIQSDISNFLHGQKCQISLADDPNYYYVGRLTITEFNPNRNFQHLIIKYDVEPFKYAHDEYDSGLVDVDTTLTAVGSPMSAVPTITSASTDLAYNPKDALTRGMAVLMIYNSISEIVSATSADISTTITLTESEFLDVDSDADYYNALLWFEERSYVSGYTDYIFAPDNGITRAQFVTLLWKTVGSPALSGNAPFKDVAKASYYYNAVKWAGHNGITIGDGEGNFSPNDIISRQQAIFMIWKLCGSTDATSSDITDVSNGELVKPWYYDAVYKLTELDVLSGYTDGTFRPSNNTTRIHFITLIWLMYGSPTVSDVTLPYEDIDSLSDDQVSALEWAYSNGWVSGTSSTTFSPSRAIYRKEAIVILFNFGNFLAEECETSGTDTDLEYYDTDDTDDWVGNGYEVPSDVAVTDWCYYAVCWGIINEVTTLSKGFQFYPDDPMTRAATAQMLYEVWCKWTQTYPEYTEAGAPYTDVVCYELNYATAVYWGYNNSILTDAFTTHDSITITVVNTRGTVSIEIPYGTREVPDLLITDGENTITASGSGQYEVQFRRGSL